MNGLTPSKLWLRWLPIRVATLLITFALIHAVCAFLYLHHIGRPDQLGEHVLRALLTALIGFTCALPIVIIGTATAHILLMRRSDRAGSVSPSRVWATLTCSYIISGTLLLAAIIAWYVNAYWATQGDLVIMGLAIMAHLYGRMLLVSFSITHLIPVAFFLRYTYIRNRDYM